MPQGKEQISYWDAVKMIVLHPIDSTSALLEPGVPSVSDPTIVDFFANAWVQSHTDQPLTRDQLNAIEQGAFNDVLNAGGTVSDAKATAKQIEDYYVNTYGPPDSGTGNTFNEILTLLTIALALGATFFVYRLAKEIAG